MSETKSIKVEFTNHLPMGEKGTFTVGKRLWVAYPAEKNQAIYSVLTKLIAIHARITKDMISWINERPQDAELVSRVLERTSAAAQLGREIAIEKNEALTS